MASIWSTPGANSGQANPFGNQTWFNPGSTYGADQSYWNTPISQNIREQNLPIAFSSYLNNLGVADNDTSFSRYIYSQFPRFERSYGLATLQNPYITIDQFLAGLPNMSGLYQEFMQQSPEARGLNTRQYAPVSRWITR